VAYRFLHYSPLRR